MMNWANELTVGPWHLALTETLVFLLAGLTLWLVIPANSVAAAAAACSLLLSGVNQLLASSFVDESFSRGSSNVCKLSDNPSSFASFVSPPR